ncbi:hypothetical protein PIROE2DRAFT_11143 [Piromyces sp. E2]|nr:hypothetical protein PIROE2DRAFT_11143 [Piromyces sp. E2]|eukprot:OUM62559.1 hypothetical protein PIROE2DRAFT_11143 [Piromyces sp. E2]
MADEEINSDIIKEKEKIFGNIPKIKLTTTSFDNYTLNKDEDSETNEGSVPKNETTKRRSDVSKLKNLFIDPKLENKEKDSKEEKISPNRNNSLRIPNKSNNVTKSLDFLTINTQTNHLQSHTNPKKSLDDNESSPIKKNEYSKSQPNLAREGDETVNLQKHISKIFNHAFSDAIYSPRDSWLASVFNIYHAIILYLSVFLECYSTQLMVQQTEAERTAWRLVSLIFTIQLCLFFIASAILYPIRKRRHLAIIEAATSAKNKKENGEVITYKDVTVTKNPFILYKGFINFSHIMEFLGCLPFFIEEIFPQCRLININHYGLISATKESIYEIISVIILYFIVMIFCSRIIFYADLSKCTLDEASQVC